MDPEFSCGSEHVAHAPVSNPTSKAWTYQAELYLVPGADTPVLSVHLREGANTIQYTGCSANFPDVLTNIGPAGLNVVRIVWYDSWYYHVELDYSDPPEFTGMVTGRTYTIVVSEDCEWFFPIKAASSGLITFTLAAGGSDLIDFPLTMPQEEGTYLVYLDVFVEGQLVAAYQAPESVTIVAPPSEPFIDKFYVVTYRMGSDCPYEVHCEVGNRGAAGTHRLELWMQPSGQAPSLVQAVTFDIDPGATYHYKYRQDFAPCGAAGRVWIVADWGEETIRIPFSAGSATTQPAHLACVATSPTCVVLRYSSRSTWNRWHLYGRTPPTGPAEHSFSIRVDYMDDDWLTIWAAIFDLLPGRTYSAGGVCDGYTAETTFTTPS